MKSNQLRKNMKSNKQGGQKQQKNGKRGVPSKAVQQAPAAMSRPLIMVSPKEKTGPRGSRTILFKEYVQDVAGSVDFTATQFSCNPGLSNLFAWLSGQALFYQEYTVKRLRFYYETEKATTLSGKVMMAFLQDSSDPPPASKQEMLENLIKAAGAIWQPFNLDVSMRNFPALGRSRFVRSGTLASNLDVKTYDIGQLVVATQGMADTSDAGELYVEYEVELKTPIQSSAQLALALSAAIDGAPTSTSDFFGSPTVTGGLDISVSGNLITFNRVGQFLIDVIALGTGLHTLFTPVGTGSTVGSLDIQAGISNAAADAGTQARCRIKATVTARGQKVGIDVATMATTLTDSSAVISMFSSTL